MTGVLCISFASDLLEMRESLDIVLTQIKNKKPYILEEELMDLRLIYSELLSNAVIHGNEYSSQKKVRIFVKITEDGVVSKISDEGNGFNYKEVLKPLYIVEDIMAEAGRGLRIASSLADELTFNGKGNEIKFYKKLAFQISEHPKFPYMNHAGNF